MKITRYYISILFVFMFILAGCSTIESNTCTSPVNFGKKVYSSDGKHLYYEIDPNINLKKEE